ncbi:MAG: hypothetical protein U0M42_08460 [Acutalibacteraceae bacterium]|nr:hypothetical protein [Acutalibacteraceae bacterium]
MSKQNTTYTRTFKQNEILDLEKEYMEKLDTMFTSKRFISDLKKIEEDTQEYYDLLTDVWSKKNKIKEASERLVRHHLYTNFRGANNFYPFPISCDVAIETKDAILNVDVKTIDKISNGGELKTTQFEHNQTSFINKLVMASPPFPGFKVKSNLQAIDPRTEKPILTYLVKIAYADDGKGTFRLVNESKKPSLVLTCLPNGALSNLFDNDLFKGFKDYNYYDKQNGVYYKPRYITSKAEFDALAPDVKFNRVEQTTDIPESWTRMYLDSKIGYYDNEKHILWYVIPKKIQNHQDMYLYAVKNGNTARYNDKWLEERFDSKNESWSGIIKHYNLYN